MQRTPGRAAAALAVLVLAPLAAATGGIVTASAATTTARTYYLSTGGNDQATGTSPETAWRSLARANQVDLNPGDHLMLRGGDRFTGGLHLEATDAGTATSPVVVGSYGLGRATITATGGPGVFAHNAAGLDVQDLVVTGDASTYATASGIGLFTDLPGAAKLDHVRITRVEVSGFRQGVEIGAWGGPTGYRDVRVTDARLHDNRDSGLLTYGPTFAAGAPAYAHENVRVLRVAAYRNLGDPQNGTRNTGSGIVLGSVRGGVVEQSTAYGNGAACTAPEGPVGIWTYDSTAIVLQQNTSYSNRTGGRADGGGFDLDQNVSASTAQYNSSWDNDGPGYLVYTGQSNDAQAGNVVRFNLSRDDVRKLPAYGALTVRGRIRGAAVHHNTVSVTSTYTAPRAALQLDGSLSGVTLRNNIFDVRGPGPVVLAPDLRTSAVRLQGNDYRSAGAPAVRWGRASYGSLAAWRSATGQELLDGRPTGADDDPLFTGGPGAAGLRLAAGSPLRTTGLDLRSLGTSPGPRDFYGTALDPSRTIFAVGAYQPPG